MMKSQKYSIPQKFRHAILSLIKMLICASAIAAFIACVALYYPESDFHFWGYVMFAVLYLIVLLSAANMYRCFNIGMLRRRELVISYCIAVLLTNGIMFFVISLLCKFIIDPIPLGITTAAQCIVGMLLLLLANRILVLGQRPSNIIFDVKIPDEMRASRDTLFKNEEVMKLRNELIYQINKDVASHIE